MDIGPRALKASTNQARLETALAQRPQSDPQILTSAVWNGPPRGEERRVELTAAKGAGLADFYPYESSEIEGSPKAVEFRFRGRAVAREADPATKSGADWPVQLAGLLDLRCLCLRGRFPVEGHGGPSGTPWDRSPGRRMTGTPTKEPSAVSAAAAPGGLLTMLGFAFLGGLILNIMPCVLPVIALMTWALGAKQSRENPGRVRPGLWSATAARYRFPFGGAGGHRDRHAERRRWPVGVCSKPGLPGGADDAGHAGHAQFVQCSKSRWLRGGGLGSERSRREGWRSAPSTASSPRCWRRPAPRLLLAGALGFAFGQPLSTWRLLP